MSNENDPKRTTDEVPSHLARNQPSEVELWRRLELKFSELCDLVETMRLETRDEAIGKGMPRKGSEKAEWKDTAPRWFDPEVGRNVRAWNLIPYIDGVDMSEVQELMDHARDLIPSLRAHFAGRRLSPVFFLEWGTFCSAAGAVQLIYFQNSKPGHRRSGKAGRINNLDDHKRWFAHYFLRLYKGRGTQEQTRDAVERLINDVLDGNVATGWPDEVSWFGRFLNLDGDQNTNDNYGRLTGAFRKGLTIEMMKRLVQEPSENLPPLDLTFAPTP